MSDSELARFVLHGLRRLSGASAATLYLPAADGSSVALLVHDGEGRPLPELADAERAAAFAAGAEGGPGGPGSGPASADAEGLLLALPPAPSAWTLLAGPRPVPSATSRRRQADRRGETGEPRGWLGLRLSAGSEAARRALAGEPGTGWLLELLSRLAAQSAQLRQALIDPVTGLPGRIGFQALLREELELAARAGRPLALLLLNPHDFASVNERHGSREGDRVLAELATLLLSQLRAEDVVARFGGAIFAVVLPDTPVERAQEVAHRLLTAAAGRAFLEGTVRLELRAGVAGTSARGISGRQGDPQRALDLVRRADEALRTAKGPSGAAVAVATGGASSDPGGLLATGDLARDYRNMALLRDAVRITTVTADLDETIQDLLDRLFSALRPDELVLFERQRDDRPAALWAVRRDPHAGRVRRREVDVGRPAAAIVQAALTTGRLRQAAWGETGGGPPTRLAWALPVAHGRRVWGVLFIAGAAESLDVGPEDLIFLEAFASQIGIAMDRAQRAARAQRRRAGEARQLRSQILELQRAVDRAVLLYKSPAVERLLAQAERLAATDASVLITGESGTGKSMLARFLHEHSPRRARGLVALDCRALPAGRAEEELFGGTGTPGTAVGLVAEADLGTLYLAQLDALSDSAQARLLAFLREPRLPVGQSREPRRLDVRLLASTGPDPAAGGPGGRLRADLLARVGLQRLAVPALRERPEDVELLVEHFLADLAMQYGRDLELSPGARRALVAHPWPGNVRELRNRVLQAVLVTTGRLLEAEAFGLEPAAEVARSRRRPRRPRAPTFDRGVEGLRRELRRQLVAVGHGAGALPLGRWLGDDLLLEVDAFVGAVARRGAKTSGLPETTYRRRLAKARSQAASGLAPRTADWHRVRERLHGLVRAPDAAGVALLDLGEEVLLTEILRLHPRDIARGAGLLGVTVPTFRRRLAGRLRRAGGGRE
jgi:diguanylate cyclase (GGDEF)-like protein